MILKIINKSIENVLTIISYIIQVLYLICDYNEIEKLRGKKFSMLSIVFK